MCINNAERFFIGDLSLSKYCIICQRKPECVTVNSGLWSGLDPVCCWTERPSPSLGWTSTGWARTRTTPTPRTGTTTTLTPLHSGGLYRYTELTCSCEDIFQIKFTLDRFQHSLYIYTFIGNYFRIEDVLTSAVSMGATVVRSHTLGEEQPRVWWPQ